MAKINKIVSTVLGESSKVAKKLDDVSKKIPTDYEKYIQEQEDLMKAAASQGKAIVAMSKTNLAQQTDITSKMKDKAIANGLSSTRSVAKALPMPKKAKETVVGAINAKIEDRHLVKDFSNKSAQSSAEAILEQSPVDLVAKKEDLMQKYGDELRANQKQRANANAQAKQEALTQNAIRELRRMYLDDTREYNTLISHIIAEIPEGKFDEIIDAGGFTQLRLNAQKVAQKSKNMAEFGYNVSGYLGKMFTDEGLVLAKKVVSKLPDSEVAPRIKTEFISALNAEIENRHLTKNLSTRTTQDVKEAFEKLEGELSTDGKLAAYKAQLYAKHGEQFENRPARKSAKAITEQSVGDLDAKKQELQKKFGNQSIIKSIMLEKKVGYDEAKKIAQDEIENDAKLFGISLEAAEARMESKARAIIDLYAQIGQKV